jgi:hypothetical protein
MQCLVGPSRGLFRLLHWPFDFLGRRKSSFQVRATARFPGVVGALRMQRGRWQVDNLPHGCELVIKVRTFQFGTARFAQRRGGAKEGEQSRELAIVRMA